MMMRTIILIPLALCWFALVFFSASAISADSVQSLEVGRLQNNPIIRPDMLPGNAAGNINGPSLIRGPAWLPEPLGNYYLYFAHHHGKLIRLAYADRLQGPWKVHQPGTLHLRQALNCKHHIASPDVHVDEERQEIRMYFHCPHKGIGSQKSFVALSRDGLHFNVAPEVLGKSYFRVFRWQNTWFATSRGHLIYRSKDGLTQFVESPGPLPRRQARKDNDMLPHVRHVALERVGSLLWMYYTNTGDAPERILRRSVQLTDDWKTWRASAREEVLSSEYDWEGADVPIQRSSRGAAKGREHALRDPAIFTDTDGRRYLLYAVAGESGIAIAELK